MRSRAMRVRINLGKVTVMTKGETKAIEKGNEKAMPKDTKMATTRVIIKANRQDTTMDIVKASQAVFGRDI